jgi:hypothetical protein
MSHFQRQLFSEVRAHDNFPILSMLKRHLNGHRDLRLHDKFVCMGQVSVDGTDNLKGLRSNSKFKTKARISRLDGAEIKEDKSPQNKNTLSYLS